MERFQVGIIGADTHTGAQLVRLLFSHPFVEVSALGTFDMPGGRISQLFPALGAICDLPLVTPDEVIQQADVVFAVASAGQSQELAAKCVQEKTVLIDLSPDFSLSSEEEYKSIYGAPFSFPTLHEAAACGLPELMRREIVGKVLVSCASAATTAAALALSPALMAGMVETRGISCAFALSESCTARESAKSEIEQILSRMSGEDTRIAFSASRVNARSGIIAACAARLKPNYSAAHLFSAYNQVYSGEPFIRVMPLGDEVSAAHVLGSNICDISIAADEKSGVVIFTAALDDLVKGSAGQAVQNMNIMLSIDETVGLELVPNII